MKQAFESRGSRSVGMHIMPNNKQHIILYNSKHITQSQDVYVQLTGELYSSMRSCLMS